MPPTTGNSQDPMTVLTQIRDLLAEVFGRQKSDAASAASSASGEVKQDDPEKDREKEKDWSRPPQGQIPDRMDLYRDLVNQSIDRQNDTIRSHGNRGATAEKRPDGFGGTVKALSAGGGGLGELAQLLQRMKSMGEGVMDIYRALSGSGEKEKKPTATPARHPLQNRLQSSAPPAPSQPSGSAVPTQSPTPAAPAPPLTPATPPPAPTPASQIPSLATSAPLTPVAPAQPTPTPALSIGTGQPPTSSSAPLPPTVLAAPLPAPAPPAPLAPTAPAPSAAPLMPTPMPGQPVDPDTQLPGNQRRDPLGQTAPALLPAAPGGVSSPGGGMDAGRLAAVLEKLVTVLEKQSHETGDAQEGDNADETEQGENLPRKNMWVPSEPAGPGKAEDAVEPRMPPQGGREEGGGRDLEPRGGGINLQNAGAVLTVLMRAFGS